MPGWIARLTLGILAWAAIALMILLCPIVEFAARRRGRAR
jgi:hypothetical protein